MDRIARAHAYTVDKDTSVISVMRSVVGITTFDSSPTSLPNKLRPHMSYVRTQKHRRQMSERIHHWRPWEKSTGPRTEAGKKRVSRNAYKGRVHSMAELLAEIRRNWR